MHYVWQRHVIPRFLEQKHLPACTPKLRYIHLFCSPLYLLRGVEVMAAPTVCMRHESSLIHANWRCPQRC